MFDNRSKSTFRYMLNIHLKNKFSFFFTCLVTFKVCLRIKILFENLILLKLELGCKNNVTVTLLLLFI